jgi:hypothetical protein
MSPAQAGLFLRASRRGACGRPYKASLGDRNAGLRWANPFCSRTKLSLRARNLDSDKIKVNDKRGNPIEVGAAIGTTHGHRYQQPGGIDFETETRR